MQNVQTFLCDKHPLLKMFRIEVSEEGKQEKFEVFKCPKPLCNRFYFFGGKLWLCRFCRRIPSEREVEYQL